MIILESNGHVEGRASSKQDFLNYLELNNYEYMACNYSQLKSSFPDKWYFAQEKEALLLGVFELNTFDPFYENGRWILFGLDEEKYGDMAETPWYLDPYSQKKLGEDASRDMLLQAYWINAQVMEACMGLKFFGPAQDMIEEAWLPLGQFLNVEAWK